MKFVSALVCAAAACMPLSAFATDTPKQDAAQQVATAAPLKLTPKDPLPKSVTQLVIIDREVGDPKSKPIAAEYAVLMHYTGWLYDPAKPDGKGEQFDSSRGKVVPFGFIVGAGRVIKGWDQGVPGMRLNGKRTLIVPAALAYGEAGAGKIPPNATLIFDVELVQVISGGANS